MIHNLQNNSMSLLGGLPCRTCRGSGRRSGCHPATRLALASPASAATELKGSFWRRKPIEGLYKVVVKLVAKCGIYEVYKAYVPATLGNSPPGMLRDYFHDVGNRVT